MDDLVRVNAHRMKVAREMAGLTVRQVAMNFDIDVRTGEHFGVMLAGVVKKVADLYGARDGWLEEHGPTADPKSVAATMDLVGAIDAPIICRRVVCHGDDGPCNDGCDA